jgi:hypothetical protein
LDFLQNKFLLLMADTNEVTMHNKWFVIQLWLAPTTQRPSKICADCMHIMYYRDCGLLVLTPYGLVSRYWHFRRHILFCFQECSVGMTNRLGYNMKSARGVTTQAHMEGGVNGPLSGTEWMKSRRTAILSATVLFSVTRRMLKWEKATTLFFVKEGKMELFSPFLTARSRLHFLTHSHGSGKISSLQPGYRIHPSPHSTHFNP